MSIIIHHPTLIRPGQRWFDRTGQGPAVYVTNVSQTGEGKWDHDVEFDWYVDGTTHYDLLNAWEFQRQYSYPRLDADSKEDK